MARPSTTHMWAVGLALLALLASSPRVRGAGADDKIDFSDSATQINAMLILDDCADLDDYSFHGTRAQRREQVYTVLKECSELTQQPVLAALNKHHKPQLYESFWIVNAIAVRNVTGEVLRKIVADSRSVTVKTKLMGRIARAASPVPVAQNRPAAPSGSVAWNIELVKAPQVWAKGFNGSGIVVGTLDGGVNYQHEALVDGYRGNVGGGHFNHDYNWRDWAYKRSEPEDDDGHGTNVQGILSASMESGVGMAPGSRWISGKIFNYAGYSANDWTLGGVQWIMCPTPVSGAGPANCSLGADVVSCSWGEDDATEGYLKKAVAAWLKAGMVPVFAVGNAGPKCKTSVSPSDYSGVLSVGATDKSDSIVAFSSRGPAANGTSGALPYTPLAPNVVAPGLSISGPSYKSDSDYKDFSGTSQAAPHVAGAAALLLSAKPELMPHDVLSAIFQGASQASSICGACDDCGAPDVPSTADGSWPNFVAGYGRLDCAASLSMLS